MAGRIQLRRGSAANWTAANPTLAAGEVAVETDTGKFKVGDGSSAWTALGYNDAGATSHIADTSDAHDASAISVLDTAGYFTGTNVETVLAEMPPLFGSGIATVSGATDTLATADAGKVNRYTNASQVTVTIPTDASDDLADGFWCLLFAEGAGGLTLSTTGITLAGSSPNKTIAQNEALTVLKLGADTWMVLGGTSA